MLPATRRFFPLIGEVGQLAQTTPEIEMMSELGGNNAAEPWACESAELLARTFCDERAVSCYSICVEIAGPRETLGAQEVAHPLAMLLIKLDDDLAVTVSAEHVA
jgi:hypothetical protein